jgi:hypothetical protein
MIVVSMAVAAARVAWKFHRTHPYTGRHRLNG